MFNSAVGGIASVSASGDVLFSGPVPVSVSVLLKEQDQLFMLQTQTSTTSSSLLARASDRDAQ